jgi:antitoxin (DNA-binding transcriptional repressor) of toxin-antitoxin stability system
MSAALASMADLFARHQARAQAAPRPTRPTPAAVAPAAPPARARAQAIERVARGDGYELRVAGVAVVRVLPVAAGWKVRNIGAGHECIRDDRAEADRLAARIARLVAAP